MNEQSKMEYKAEPDEALKRKKMYNDNLFKAYALIWERCAKAMQNKLLARSDYEDEIYNNPIKLLKAIKEHALNYQETRYEMSIISDAFRALWNTTQKENENLQDYTRRFKTSKDILESHLGGPIQLTKYVKLICDDESEIEGYTKKASEQLFAFLYLENASQDKYGSILRSLNSQKSLGNYQYPRTITEANNVLSNHNFDTTRLQKHQKPNRQQNKQQDDGESKNDESPTLSFAQLEGKCYCCGKAGHKSPDCRHKEKIPRDEWAINKAQSHAQAKNDEQSVAGTTTTNRSTQSVEKKDGHIGWAGIHCTFAQGVALKDLILLDSDSTDTIFCNPKYVKNIRQAESTLELGTNGGPLVSNQICDIPDLGKAWFNKDSIANIISLAHMISKYKVTYDSEKEKAFLVHMPNKIV